jgi:hypothetical protein
MVQVYNLSLIRHVLVGIYNIDWFCIQKVHLTLSGFME